MGFTHGAGGSTRSSSLLNRDSPLTISESTMARHHAHPSSPPSLDEDDLSIGPGGKKRKVPVPVVPGSQAEVDSGRDGADRNPARSAREDGESSASMTTSLPIRRLPRTSASRLAQQRRALFLRRKAGLVALYLDAQGAIDATLGSAYTSGTHSTIPPPSNSGTAVTSTGPAAPALPAGLPDVSTFERLLPVLEDVGTWAPDAPGWRDGNDSAALPVRRSFDRWRTGFARRKRQRFERVPVARGGWAPEGSFELDIPTEASARTRARARERLALAKLAEQLRALILAANKLPTPPDPPPGSPDDFVPVVSADPPTSGSPSSPSAGGGAKKKGKKKKKRSTLANEGNPHHVDNYRPTRSLPESNPYEAWPHHSKLLFPPPMRLLAARPGGQDTRPAEDDYICASCEYALFYGPEALRKRAVRERRAEIRRREKLRERARDVTHGRARFHTHDSEDDYEDEYDDADGDDVGCEGDDDSGRCTCGRALRRRKHGADEDKLPDKDPP